MTMHLKNIQISLFTITVLLLFQTLSYGQMSYGMGIPPRQSPDKHLFHRIGYTDIEIKYSSPAVKNRKVWGELVPYDKVWRAGANNATTIAFAEDVEINGQSLTAGTYGFFILPKGTDKWELIFNGIHEQWGAFSYDKTKDVLRVQSLPIQSKFAEDLIYTVENKGPEYGTVFLNWGRYKIGFEVKTNHMNYVEKALTESRENADPILKWVCYVEGANFLLNKNTKLDLAMEWIELGEKEVLELKEEWNPKYIAKEFIMGNMYWIKARLLANKKDFKGALKAADKMKLLTGESLYYPKFNEEMKIDDKIATWKKE